MATMNVSLPDPMKTWVEEQVQSGQYSNASDYVRDLIRRDQQYRDQREVLVRALVEGERSGVTRQTVSELWNGIRKRHDSKV